MFRKQDIVKDENFLLNKFTLRYETLLYCSFDMFHFKIRYLKAVLDCIVGIVMSVGIVADAE